MKKQWSVTDGHTHGHMQGRTDVKVEVVMYLDITILKDLQWLKTNQKVCKKGKKQKSSFELRIANWYHQSNTKENMEKRMFQKHAKSIKYYTQLNCKVCNFIDDHWFNVVWCAKKKL